MISAIEKLRRKFQFAKKNKSAYLRIVLDEANSILEEFDANMQQTEKALVELKQETEVVKAELDEITKLLAIATLNANKSKDMDGGSF